MALTLGCAEPPPASPVRARFVDGIVLLEVTLQGKAGLALKTILWIALPLVLLLVAFLLWNSFATFTHRW